jgi:hypothetical protein
MSREGACPCGAVRYAIDGPVRDVIVCHCSACRAATGGPWPASAAHRPDLVIDDPSAIAWDRAAISEYGASRGRCSSCGTTVFWDAPERETISFGVATLADAAGIEIAAEIWVSDAPAPGPAAGVVPHFAAALPAVVRVPWRD